MFEELLSQDNAVCVFHCKADQSKYYSAAFDNVNNMFYYDFFPTKREAVDHICEKLGCNKTVKDFEEDESHGNFTEEKDGKLYCHWVYYEHTMNNLLFDPVKYVNPPKTKDELRQYFEDGNQVTAHWGTRAPVDCCVNNILLKMEGPKSVYYYTPDFESSLKRGMRRVLDHASLDASNVYEDEEDGQISTFTYVRL